MANSIGYSGTVGMTSYSPEKYAQASELGQITYNMDSPSFGQDNYFDFYCTLLHENHHVMTPGDFGTFESEYYAYKAVNDSYFYSLASDEYKAHIQERYDDYRIKLGYSM